MCVGIDVSPGCGVVGGRAGQRSSGIDEFAARIDELLAKRRFDAGIEPAPACTDGEFLRRVSLDLTGVVPRASLA